jgi:rifampin ADP-ribosylating transferase
MSYRSRQPLRVAGEVTDWQGHSPETLKAMKDNVERSRQQLGIEAIDAKFGSSQWFDFAAVQK